jgi:hypothetical protein
VILVAHRHLKETQIYFSPKVLSKIKTLLNSLKSELHRELESLIVEIELSVTSAQLIQCKIQIDVLQKKCKEDRGLLRNYIALKRLKMGGQMTAHLMTPKLRG